MASIKPLSEAVHSSMRSGIILFDLTRVVEELVYNSLDAGATKVAVSIGIGTCYVKVVDDGCGITRDGLVLLGERYATSKLHRLADMDDTKGSYGFRGEALGSISDVSLLEIVTKAQGRPIGYRKVMKGCKCLYLGIDDDRQDVGTTVVVRDLFYNQPVRRKQMQSSPGKVLHSVKKCVLLIALVHSKVSFKVVDVESEDEVFYTHPSSSPLSLVMSGFGIAISGSLHELNLSDGILKLSGYVSGPYDTFSMKALQYIYINSRFVCKGPIHKLLNQLATRFKCLDPLKVNNGAQNGKRNGSQAHPSYILNLGCPWSFYDLTFEPSKTSVEFKDWVPILKFMERAITQFWSEKMADGKSFSHESGMPEKDEMWEEGDNNVSAEEDFFVADLSKKSETATKVHWIQNQQVSVGNPSSPVEIPTEESGHVPDREDDRISSHKSHKKTAEFKEQQTEMGFNHQNEYSFKSWDGSLSKCISTANRESDNHLWTLDKDFFSSEDNFLENNFTATERSDDYMEDCFFGSSWGEESLKVDPNISRSTGSVRSYDCFEFSNHVEAVSKDLKKAVLQSCSSRGSTPSNGVLFARDEVFEFQIDDFRTKRKRLIPDDNIDGIEVDGSNQNVDFFPRTLWQDGSASGWFSTRLRKKCNMHTDLDFLSRDSAKLFSLDREHFTEEDDFLPDSAAEIGKFGSDPLSLNSEWHPMTSDPPLFKKSMHWDIEHITRENALDWSLRSVKSASYEDFAKREGNDCIFSYDSMLNSLSQGNCSSSSCTNNELDFNGFASPKRDICKFLQGHNLDIFSPRRSDLLTDETDWSCLDSCGKYNTDNFAKSSYCIPSFTYIDKGENRRDLLGHQDYGQYYVHKERSIRSCSAPPFYRGKKKFVALNDHLTVKAGKPNAQAVHEASTLPETSKLKHPQKSSGACHLYFKPTSVEDSLLEVRPDMKKMPDITPDMNEIQKSEEFEKSQYHHIYDNGSIKDCIAEEPQDSIDTGIKWRNSHSHTANGNESPNFHDQCNILDISSGILHLAGNSLVPKSINKNCLEDAKVLQQVDKKFIPVVGGGTLAIIDQHAADERIRLEDLRQKVLLGEVKTITYLDAEQELVLPEIGYQLLHNYAEQIQNWGWICNIHAQGSRSFTKNLNLLHRQPAVVTLLAVPCILGVNLSDIDLLEFLQQLADTDGSSAMPPSVVRILNFKACRGAIMFGDTLLPSECSLIVEELKQTSLCFQCAHGRPTTVPLVNLEALHKQITKLGLLNDGSNESWHGLCRHELSLERTAQRLNLARGQC